MNKAKISRCFKKFKLSKHNYFIAAAIDFVFFVLYCICLNYLKDPNASQYIIVNICSNILLVGISVITTSLLTIPMIEVNSKNSFYNDTILKDVLASPHFYERMSKEDRLELLKGLEANIYFENSKIRESMYQSIRNSLLKYGKDEDDGKIYLEKCNYRIKCEVCGDYFKKTVLKTCELYSYEKFKKSNFPLCATAAPKTKKENGSMVTSIEINGTSREVEDCIRTEVEDIKYDPFSKKSGYDRSITHYYTGDLVLRPDKPTKLKICYETYVPLHDTFYSCRTPYPCHEFSLVYELSGDKASDYSLAVCAFGFSDDAKDSPNRQDDKPEIEVKFNDWIFPLDGVAVTMKKKCNENGKAGQ